MSGNEFDWTGSALEDPTLEFQVVAGRDLLIGQYSSWRVQSSPLLLE